MIAGSCFRRSVYAALGALLIAYVVLPRNDRSNWYGPVLSRSLPPTSDGAARTAHVAVYGTTVRAWWESRRVRPWIDAPGALVLSRHVRVAVETTKARVEGAAGDPSHGNGTTWKMIRYDPEFEVITGTGENSEDQMLRMIRQSPHWPSGSAPVPLEHLSSEERSLLAQDAPFPWMKSMLLAGEADVTVVRWMPWLSYALVPPGLSLLVGLLVFHVAGGFQQRE